VARTLTDTFSGIDPQHAGPFVAAQLVGAMLAVPFFGLLLGPAGERKLRSPAAHESSGTVATSGRAAETKSRRTNPRHRRCR
jgi:hypothetical protein